MSTRTLVVLASLLLLGLALLWWEQRPAEPIDDALIGEPFLPELAGDVSGISRITVRVDGGEVLVDLVRDENRWYAQNRWQYPASTTTARSVLLALAEARRVEPRTADPSQYHRLGLADLEAGNPEGMEITLTDADGAVSVAALVGRSAPAGAGTYARRLDEATSWIVSELIPRPRRVGDWLAADLADIPLERIASVRIDPVDGTPIRIVNPDAGGRGHEIRDVPAGYQVLTPAMARSLARITTELELEDVWPEADAPAGRQQSRVHVETFDGLMVEITAYVGEDPARTRMFRLRALANDEQTESRAKALNERWQDWVFQVPEYKYDNATMSLDRIIEEVPQQ